MHVGVFVGVLGGSYACRRPIRRSGDGETGSLGHFWLGRVTFIMLKDICIVVTVNKGEVVKVYGYI